MNGSAKPTHTRSEREALSRERRWFATAAELGISQETLRKRLDFLQESEIIEEDSKLFARLWYGLGDVPCIESKELREALGVSSDEEANECGKQVTRLLRHMP